MALEREAADYTVKADVWQSGIIFANMLGVLPVGLEAPWPSAQICYDIAADLVSHHRK